MPATAQARGIRDEELARIRSQPFKELGKRYNGRTEHRVVERATGRYDITITGSYDRRDDPTSGLFVWIYVRPAFVARVPLIRWLLSARGVLLLDDE